MRAIVDCAVPESVGPEMRPQYHSHPLRALMPSYSTCYPPFPLRSSDLYAPFPVHVFAVVLESSIEGLTYHLLMLSAVGRFGAEKECD